MQPQPPFNLRHRWRLSAVGWKPCYRERDTYTPFMIISSYEILKNYVLPPTSGIPDAFCEIGIK